MILFEYYFSLSVSELYSLTLSFGGCSLHYNPDYSWADVLNYHLPDCSSYILTSGKRAVCQFSERCSRISVKCQTPTVFASTSTVYCMSHFGDVAHALPEQLCEQQIVARAWGESNADIQLSKKRQSHLKDLYLNNFFLFIFGCHFCSFW